MTIDYKKFNSKKFLSSEPFSNIVIDGLFDKSFLSEIELQYPGRDTVQWWKYDNHFEKKLACNRIDEMPQCIQKFFNLVNSREFVKNLEMLTGIEMLIADPSLNGGGLHRIERGGKLDIHADYNFHKTTGWRRRLNMITFLNNDWKEEYGGHTEFWNKDMSKCVTKILPVFNRTVIFAVDDDSYHGHPEPLSCPTNRSRMSLATYYYTLYDGDVEDIEYRSTDFKRRPDDDIVSEIESLRNARRKGRLKDDIS